jgi:hypothetical protein
MLQRKKLDEMDRIASIDSPFAEALLAEFTRYFGRVGTPDLDLDYIINRYRQLYQTISTTADAKEKGTNVNSD